MEMNTYIEVDLNAFENNLRNIQDFVGEKEVLPVVKADVYGIGTKQVLPILRRNNIKMVCVALVIEGIRLRKLGWDGEILVLNPCFKEDIPDILDNDLTIGVSDKMFILVLDQNARERNQRVKVHLEIESGMGRTGVLPKDVPEYLSTIQNSTHLDLDGIYTHFSTSDEKYSEYLKKQIINFKQALECLEEKEISVNRIHMSNSGAILQIAEDFTTAVRPGLILHGFSVNPELDKTIELKPDAKLVSRISFLKEVERDTSIGYGRRYITKKTEKIATIPIGYADGIPRELIKKGEVVINGSKCMIVGVCMDSILVNATDSRDVKVGDKVYIWDNDKIHLEDVAFKANTINYEILSRISKRVQRKYIETTGEAN